MNQSIMLQLVSCLLWRTNEETAVVVDPASDEHVDERSSHVVVAKNV